MTKLKTTTTFADTIKEIEEAIEAAKKKASTALMAEFKDVFERHPELKIIKWAQYTPYFNDGDECVFRVNDIYASNYEEISSWGEWEGDDDEPDDLECIDIQYTRSSKYSDLQALGNFMSGDTGEEILKFTFGDHVIVTVTPQGIETTDYDHD